MVAQGTSATSLEKSVIAGFNSKLTARVSNLTTTHSGVKTWLWDSNARFSQILDNPTAFGFVDNSSYGNTGDFWGCVRLYVSLDRVFTIAMGTATIITRPAVLRLSLAMTSGLSFRVWFGEHTKLNHMASRSSDAMKVKMCMK